MNTETPTNEPVKAIGRRYASVADLMKGENISPAVVSKVKELTNVTKLTHQLSILRHAAGITQEQMAEKLSVNQPAISKLENGLDENLTIAQIRAYAEITKSRMGIVFGEELSHAEAVKMHAAGLKKHLLDLAKLANSDDQMEKNINAFFAEAFMNYLGIFAHCAQQMPKNSNGMRLLMFDDPKPIPPSSLKRPKNKEPIAV